MERAHRVIGASLVLMFLLVTLACRIDNVAAQSPVRRTTIVIPYTEYEWWLLTWDDNQLVCRVLINHEGLPTADEVMQNCGNDITSQWLSTKPCKVVREGRKLIIQCEGLYLHLVSFQPKQKEMVIDLPLPQVWVNLEGCTPSPPENRCAEIPDLVLTGDEPLPNEHIVAIHGIFDANPFSCNTSTCTLPLHTTPLEGVSVEFWADSSYGDSSEHFTAQVRVIDAGVSVAPGTGGWYVDVISSQWQGAPIASCARIWEAFPPVGGPPSWLSTPVSSELMASDAPYYYLAGRLIAQGEVQAAECPSGGLLPNGYADACGLDKARSIVDTWQNQFDKRIIEIAKQTGVPAQLMKNLFAQESQFWPGVFRVQSEYGLGQITENGADSVLLWDSTFFAQFCPLVLAQDACDSGYLHLKAEDQAILRGALALQAKSDCTDCPTGIDLSNVDFSVTIFANSLQANCAQVAQTIFTATKRTAGQVANYEDLWRFTVANYHAGPGCVSYAIHQAWQNVGILNWDQVASRFTDPCKGVVPYVNKITK